MAGMSMLEILLILWGVVTTILAGLLIYRFLVAMKEEDTLVLSAAESKIVEEQRQVLDRLSRIRPFVLGFSWLSAALLAASIGLWVYQKLKAADLG